MSKVKSKFKNNFKPWFFRFGISLVVLLLLLTVAVPLTQAANDPYGIRFFGNTGLGQKDPRDVIASIIRVIMGFLGTIAVLLVLLGGFKWMTAMGNQDKVDEARRTLVSGIVGLIIVLSAFGIATFVIDQLIEATFN